MHEPMPEVFFTAFGASTLDHELRLYVRELRDRSRTAVDELETVLSISRAVKNDTSTLP